MDEHLEQFINESAPKILAGNSDVSVKAAVLSFVGKIGELTKRKTRLTVYEFCEEYRVSRSTLYHWWRHGKGPSYHKVGGQTFINITDAEDWVTSNKR